MEARGSLTTNAHSLAQPLGRSGVSIMIVQAFVRLREMMAANKDLAARIEKLEHGQRQTGSNIEVLVDEIDKMKMLLPSPKRKIGFDL